MWEKLAEWIRSDEAKAELKRETLWKQLIVKAFQLLDACQCGLIA